VPLPRAFYLRSARAVARDLLGCTLVSRRGRTIASGRIVETEAYLGPEDGASHAAFRPGSHWLFYGDGGLAYVFLNYGTHHCLNAIAGPAGTPGCVLIRALEPLSGLTAMARRRGVAADARRLASGPGNLTRALAVSLRDNGADLARGPLTIEPAPEARRFRIASGPRVGITRSVELPLRFWIADNPFVSR
jgi:DNA-3-methyladenine glycosylase